MGNNHLNVKLIWVTIIEYVKLMWLKCQNGQSDWAKSQINVGKRCYINMDT